MGHTPLSGHKLYDKLMDERINLLSDPNDPDGGYLPFDDFGYPRVAMSWLERGRFMNLAYAARGAASQGVTPGNTWCESLRLAPVANTPLLTVEEMIGNCKEGIYVNRVADISIVHPKSGLMTGVTQGGCFLVRNGKIDKAVKDFRFLDSAYFFLNKLDAIGRAERAPFGYAPWHGDWPIAPTIVPPVMVHDFNFSGLADSV
jgi:predicted Zn-dependent protease